MADRLAVPRTTSSSPSAIKVLEFLGDEVQFCAAREIREQKVMRRL